MFTFSPRLLLPKIPSNSYWLLKRELNLDYGKIEATDNLNSFTIISSLADCLCIFYVLIKTCVNCDDSFKFLSCTQKNSNQKFSTNVDEEFVTCKCNNHL